MLMASTSIILLLVVTLVRLAIWGLVVYAVIQGDQVSEKVQPL